MGRRAAFAAFLLVVFAGQSKANDFLDPIFATPIRNTPGAYVPPGSVLNAPVITPIGTKHGHTLFDVTPMGDAHDSIVTRHPDQYLTSQWECHAWITVDSLYWATRGSNAPPLVTTGPPFGGPGLDAAYGNPRTAVLLGDAMTINGMRPGVRVAGGFFLDGAKEWAIGYSGTFLGSRSENLEGGSDGTGIVNLPQFNSVFGVPIQTPVYVGYPGLTRGTVVASVQSSFAMATGELRRVAQSGTGYRFDLIGGYRYMHLGDSIATSFDVVSATIPGPASPRLMGEQSVRTRNVFNGADAGFQFSGRFGRRLTFDIRSTVAIGATTTEIDRSFTRSYIAGGPLGALVGVPIPPVGIPLIQTGGLTKETELAFVPQIGLKIGFEPIDHIRFTAGYDFVYWSRVRRAPEAFTGNDVVTDFWAQGLTAGFEFRY